MLVFTSLRRNIFMCHNIHGTIPAALGELETLVNVQIMETNLTGG
jgi:hypothetical protein